MTIEFSVLNIIIENKHPDIDDFKAIPPLNKIEFKSCDTHCLITTSLIENNFFWIYIEYGKLLPYSDIVVNTKTHTIENNPRTPSQVETSKQLFGLYDFNNKNLYLSNRNKKQIIEEHLKSILSKDVLIKSYFKTAEEFCEKIKSINHIKFTTKRNLFNLKDDPLSIFPIKNDIFGLGMAEDFTLEVNFSNAKITKNFYEILKKISKSKNEHRNSSLVCIGLDEKHIETVFNIDEFIQKIIIHPPKDDRGIFNPNTVLENLIREAKKTYEKKN